MSYKTRSYIPLVSILSIGPLSNKSGLTLLLVISKQIRKDIGYSKAFYVHISILYFKFLIARDLDGSANKELDILYTCSVVIEYSRSGSKVLNYARVCIVNLDAL